MRELYQNCCFLPAETGKYSGLGHMSTKDELQSQLAH